MTDSQRQQMETNYWAMRRRLQAAQDDARATAKAAARRAGLDTSSQFAKAAAAAAEVSKLIAAKWNAEIAQEPLQVRMQYCI